MTVEWVSSERINSRMSLGQHLTLADSCVGGHTKPHILECNTSHIALILQMLTGF